MLIDTDKYEGHTEGPWSLGKSDTRNKTCNDMVMGGDDYEVAFIYGGRTGDRKRISSDALLIADAPLLLAAYDKQVRWINDILFRLEKMDDASTGQRLRFLLTVQNELEMMIK